MKIVFLFLVAGMAQLLFSAVAHADGIPPTVRLDNDAAAAWFETENGTASQGDCGGVPGWRWQPASRQTSRFFIKQGSPILERLCLYDRLEFEMRIVSGSISEAGLEAMGHVSGARRYKVHQWNVAVVTTERGVWHTRLLDLSRPNWFPWDNPDGEGAEPFFRFSALALEENTVIELRDIRLVRPSLTLKPDYELPVTWPIKKALPDGGIVYELSLSVLNTSGRPLTAEATILSKHTRFALTMDKTSQDLKAGATAAFRLTATMSGKDLQAVPDLYEEPLVVGIAPQGHADAGCRWAGVLVRPFSATLRRQAILDRDSLAQIRERVAAGDAAMLKALDLSAWRARADGMCAKKLNTLPRGHTYVKNGYPTVPGADGPEQVLPGAEMPEAATRSGSVHEIGTVLAGQVWKEYLAFSGQACESLGMAYLYTGDETYAAKAIELLSLFGKQYTQLEWNSAFDAPWNRGTPNLASSRIASSSTYGSNWYLKGLCRMASCVAESPTWTDEARRAVYEGFVLPYATELMKFPGGISNMTDISNHNVLLLGIAFDDANLVRWALRSDPGLVSRLRDIDADGFSSEGRPINYHLAAMAEYLPSIGYLGNMGVTIDFPKERLLAAVRMPFRRATLGGFIPSSGDCGRGQAARANPLADALISLFPEETWLWDVGASPVRRLMGNAPSGKSDWKALLEKEPVLFKEAGLAVLRTGDTPETQIQVTFDYGKAIFHAALDRNNVALSAFGRVFTHGTGSLYNVGSGGMERTEDARLASFCGHGSLGHNVIMIDREDQLPSVGTLVAWHADGKRQLAAARVDGVRPGVTHTRAVVLTQGIVIMLDEMKSADEHEYDFAWHSFGALALGGDWAATPMSKPFGTTANYGNVVNPHSARGTAPFDATWTLDPLVLPGKSPKNDVKPGDHPDSPLLQVWHLASLPGIMVVGTTGMNNPDTKRMPDAAPSFFHRVKGTTVRYATVLEPRRGQASTVVKVEAADAGGVTVTLADGKPQTFTLDTLIKE